MSDAIAFDSHSFVKRLTACGFTERQAEGLAEEQISLLEANLATRDDIAAVRGDLAATKAGLEVKIETVGADIAATKADLLKWMLGALIAQGGMIVALVKLLP